MRIEEVPVTAALGPTNTGKTWVAVTRMLGRSSGCIGLPLRLLAREVYERIVAEKGAKYAALVTGEEKIIPKTARWFACTVESMPDNLNGRPFAFIGIDEVQLTDDPERGHIFTDRLLHMRGSEETMVMGSGRMQNLLQKMRVQNAHEVRHRFSPLTHIGHIKLSSLPKRTAIVAFSVEQVYSLAETMRRLKGGAAIVMGNLSPQTRNAQVAMFQSGEVDYLIATDAIGLGLNMDICHVAMAQITKFDGRLRRELFPYELAQIVGRAGRGTRPGSFGTTASARPLDPAVVRQIEENQFSPVSKIYWRNSCLDFTGVDELKISLAAKQDYEFLRRIRRCKDEMALYDLAADDILPLVTDAKLLRRLWAVCQIPDFRNIGVDQHFVVLRGIARQLLADDNLIATNWFSKRLQNLEETSGTIDVLADRLAYIRTWSYCASRKDWLADPEHWQEVCRDMESRLSDALHEKLVERFVDRRTSYFLQIAKSGEIPVTDFKKDGAVEIEGHLAGYLRGFVFHPISRLQTAADKVLRQAALKVIEPEVKKQMEKLIVAEDKEFSLNDQGRICWSDKEVGQLIAGAGVLQPQIEVLAETSDPIIDKVKQRLENWLQTEMRSHLSPLLTLQKKINASELDPAVRGLGFRLLEALGSLDRRKVATELKDINQDQRAGLRECGVRFGEFSLFMPTLLRPAPSRLLAILLAFGVQGNKKPYIAPAGLTSFTVEGEVDLFALSVAGLRKCAERLVRLDILERIGAEIRSARGQSSDGGFKPTLEMVALLGCSKPELVQILTSLGFVQTDTVKDEAGEIDQLASSWSIRSVKKNKNFKRQPSAKKPKFTKQIPKKKKPQQEKKIDPDSPFAVLQGLNLDKQ